MQRYQIKAWYLVPLYAGKSGEPAAFHLRLRCAVGVPRFRVAPDLRGCCLIDAPRAQVEMLGQQRDDQHHDPGAAAVNVCGLIRKVVIWMMEQKATFVCLY